MALSGSIDYAQTRIDIITEALEQLGVLGSGESPSSDDITACSRTLNYMLKAWQPKNINLFAVQKVYLFLQEDTIEYSLSSSGSHFTTSYVQTAIATAGSSSDTTIEVASITGISASDNIGVEMDDGTIHWTTVNGAPSGTTVTLTAALDAAASVGRVVYTYTSKANRPMQILNANLRTKDGNETPLAIEARKQYVELNNKNTEGQINTIYYDPQITTGKLLVWPEETTLSNFIVLYVLRTLDDLDADSDNVAFPQEWYLAIALNLAALVAPKYGAVSRETFYLIRSNAKDALDDAMSFDTESYIQIVPEIK